MSTIKDKLARLTHCHDRRGSSRSIRISHPHAHGGQSDNTPRQLLVRRDSRQ